MELQNSKYVAFVPARSGSKRLKDKNIKLLNGKPLVIWTLEAVVSCKKISQVIFSTDSLEYWNLVKSYIKSEKITFDFREINDASDNVKIFDYLKNNNKKIFSSLKGAFILALPTAPFRNKYHIEEAIKLFESSNKPVFSATEFSFPISFAFKLKNKKWDPVFKNSPMITGNTRSQDQEKVYRPNGAIYIRRIEDLLDNDMKTLYDDAVPFIMDIQDSIDIDNISDFNIAEAIMKKKSKN
jgi:CMP-N,N'-diacetyllegionaminic acid synthase